MVDPCKCASLVLGVVVFFGIIIGLLVILSKNNTDKRKGFSTGRPLPEDGPTISFYPSFSESNVIWHKEESMDNSLIEYNKRDNIFIVKKANIFSIKVVLHFDASKLSRDLIGAACIVLSDGRKICKADVFLEGSPGIFHLKQKIYARQGFSFSIRILNPSSTIKAVARNIVAITQSFHSGPDAN